MKREQESVCWSLEDILWCARWWISPSGEESRKARRLMRNEVTSLDRSLLFRLCEMRKEIQKPTWQLLLDWTKILIFFFLAGICQGQFTSGFSALNTGPFCLGRRLDWFFLQAGAQRAFIVAWNANTKPLGPDPHTLAWLKEVQWTMSLATGKHCKCHSWMKYFFKRCICNSIVS